MRKFKRLRTRKRTRSLTPSFWVGVTQAVDLQGQNPFEIVVRIKYLRTMPARVSPRFKIASTKASIGSDFRKIGRDLANAVEKVASQKPEPKGLDDGRLAGS